MPSFRNDTASAAKLWCGHHIALRVDGPDGLHREILVEKPFARVGRDQRSEVPLFDRLLFPCHLYLHATDEGIYCVDLAREKVGDWLQPSESVQIGPFRLAARLANATDVKLGVADLQAKDPGLVPSPRLRVYSARDPSHFTDLFLKRRLTLLGRESPATRRVKHPTISRVHCAIYWDTQELWMVDLFSSNGSRLNGKRFDAGRLTSGEEFRLGVVRFVYLGAGTDASDSSPEITAAEATVSQRVVELWGADDEAPAGIVEQQAELASRLQALEEDLLVIKNQTDGQHSLLLGPLADVRAALEDLQQQIRLPESRWKDELRQQTVEQETKRQELGRVWEERFVTLQNRIDRAYEALGQRLQMDREAGHEAHASRTDELIRQLAELRTANELTQEQSRTLAEDLAEARQALMGMQEKISREETQPDPRSADDAAKRVVEPRLRELEAELMARMASAEQQILSLRQFADHATARTSDGNQSEAALREHEQAIAEQLVAIRTELTAESAALRQESNTASQEIQRFAAALVNTQEQISSLQAEVAAKTRRPLGEGERFKESLRQAEARWTELIEGLNRRSTELARQVATDREERTLAAEQFAQDMSEMRRQLAATQQQLAQLYAELTTAIELLRKQSETAERDCKRLDLDLTTTRQTLAQSREEIAEHLSTDRERAEALPMAEERWADMAEALTCRVAKLEQIASGRQEDTRLADRAGQEFQETVAQLRAEQQRLAEQSQQANADKIAALAATFTAKLAALRGIQDQLKEQVAQRTRAELPSEPPNWPDPGGFFCDPARQAAVPRPPAIVDARDFVVRRAQDDLPAAVTAGSDAEADVSPEWVISDDVTQRMLDIKANRERWVWHRRLFWVALAIGLVALIILAAGTTRFWLSRDDAAEKPNATWLKQPSEFVPSVPRPGFSEQTAN
jgi:hypothetical protein